jgi:hypothetical protein
MDGWAVEALREAVCAMARAGRADLAADMGRLAEAIDAVGFVAWRHPGSDRISSGLEEAQSRDDLGALLGELAAWARVEHVSFQVVAEGSAIYATRMITSLPTDWLEHYVGRRLHGLDPVLITAVARDRPFFWSEIRGCDGLGCDLTPHAVGFWREAERFGIGPSGLTVPMAGEDGGRLALSLVSSLPEDGFVRRIHELRHDLFVLVGQFAEAFHRVAVACPGTQPILTDEQVSLLRAVASGEEERAILIRLAAVGDPVRIQRTVIQAFGARTLAQAAVIAARCGLLSDGPLMLAEIDRVPPFAAESDAGDVY